MASLSSLTPTPSCVSVESLKGEITGIEQSLWRSISKKLSDATEKVINEKFAPPATQSIFYI